MYFFNMKLQRKNMLFKQDVFVTHECPGRNKVHIGYFEYTGHCQGHKVIDNGVIWKGFISWEFMPNKKFLSLIFQMLLSR